MLEKDLLEAADIPGSRVRLFPPTDSSKRLAKSPIESGNAVIQLCARDSTVSPLRCPISNGTEGILHGQKCDEKMHR